MGKGKFNPAMVVAMVLIFGGIFIGDCIDRTVGFFVILIGCICAVIGLIQRKKEK